MSVPPPLLVPAQRAAVVGSNGQASNEWYEFFRRLLAYMQQTGVDPAVVASILARLDELEQDALGNFLIQGLLSVEVQGTPSNGAVVLQLTNDEASPGKSYQYMVSPDGIKGWHLRTPDEYPDPFAIHLVDGNGNYLVDADNNFLAGGRVLNVITQRADFPAPVGNVITLANGAAYQIHGLVDMTGYRIVCGTNNTIEGASSAACGLLFPDTLGATRITGTSSLAMRNLQLQSNGTDALFSLNNGATGVLLWTGIQVLNTPTFGTISNYQNVVWKDTIVSNTANLTLDGTFASFVAETSLFDGRAGQTTITVPATATFLRRFRMLYTAFQVDAGETGINFSASATIPDEAYILDNVSFAGAGTYLAGLTYTSNKTLFFNCSGTGFVNSNAVTQYTMTGNATATTIAVAGTFVKVAGTTVTESAVEQKFNTTTANRAQYTGAFIGSFLVTVFASMTSGNNQNLRMRIAVNGTTVAASNALFQTSGSGAASNIGTQLLRTLNPNDYVEVFVTNDTAANNITVSDINVTVTRF